jgi:hypothetical protein
MSTWFGRACPAPSDLSMSEPFHASASGVSQPSGAIDQAAGPSPHGPRRAAEGAATRARQVGPEDEQAGLALVDDLEQRLDRAWRGHAQQLGRDPELRGTPRRGAHRLEILLVGQRRRAGAEQHDRGRVGPQPHDVDHDERGAGLQRAGDRHLLCTWVDAHRERAEHHRRPARPGGRPAWDVVHGPVSDGRRHRTLVRTMRRAIDGSRRRSVWRACLSPPAFDRLHGRSHGAASRLQANEQTGTSRNCHERGGALLDLRWGEVRWQLPR